MHYPDQTTKAPLLSTVRVNSLDSTLKIRVIDLSTGNFANVNDGSVESRIFFNSANDIASKDDVYCTGNIDPKTSVLAINCNGDTATAKR